MHMYAKNDNMLLLDVMTDKLNRKFYIGSTPERWDFSAIFE